MRYHRKMPYKHRSAGHQKASEHIRAANELSAELGGTDQDVKEYFFHLPQVKINQILDKYGQQYGAKARKYAEKALPDWKSGETHMSGMVAERLFNLIPPIMPIEDKLKLVESLWNHVEPSSIQDYYIGTDADINLVSRSIQEYLENTVTHHQIPNSLEKRFDWLAQGDVGLKQQLLNLFRQKEKQLLAHAIRTHLPVLKRHLISEKGKLTTHMEQTFEIGKHKIRVEMNNQFSGISEIRPAKQAKQDNNNWIWWVILIIVSLIVLNQ